MILKRDYNKKNPIYQYRMKNPFRTWIEVAKDFEVSEQTILRWANFSKPEDFHSLPLNKIQVINEIVKMEIEKPW